MYEYPSRSLANLCVHPPTTNAHSNINTHTGVSMVSCPGRRPSILSCDTHWRSHLRQCLLPLACGKGRQLKPWHTRQTDIRYRPDSHSMEVSSGKRCATACGPTQHSTLLSALRLLIGNMRLQHPAPRRPCVSCNWPPCCCCCCRRGVRGCRFSSGSSTVPSWTA